MRKSARSRDQRAAAGRLRQEHRHQAQVARDDNSTPAPPKRRENWRHRPPGVPSVTGRLPESSYSRRSVGMASGALMGMHLDLMLARAVMERREISRHTDESISERTVEVPYDLDDVAPDVGPDLADVDLSGIEQRVMAHLSDLVERDFSGVEPLALPGPGQRLISDRRDE